MKHVYKIIFSALLAIASYTAMAEIQFKDVNYNNSDEASEPRLQLKLFPGVARVQKKSLAMPMLDLSTHTENVLKLKPTSHLSIYDDAEYVDDTKFTSNNILEVHF